MKKLFTVIRQGKLDENKELRAFMQEYFRSRNSLEK